MRNILITVSILFLSAPAYAENISGRALIIDGDTLIINREVIRLQGIDAPEYKKHKAQFQQLCEITGKKWECGKESTDFLRAIIGKNITTCSYKKRGKYGRILGRCRAGNIDLNSEMVRSGMAIAYRYFDKTYIPEEEEAQKTHHGLWAGTFEKPHLVRKRYKNITPEWYK